MSNCRECKDKNDAGCVYQNASCIRYNTVVPDWSKITACANIEETTAEIYKELTSLRTKFAPACSKITYVRETDSTVTQLNAIKGIETALCTLLNKEESSTTNILNINIKNTGLDFKCLTTQCGNEIVTLKDLLQILINKSCP
jgi:hypothetical protein